MFYKFLYPSLILALFACTSSQPTQTIGPDPTIPAEPGEEISTLVITVIVTNEVAQSLHGIAPASDDSQELLQTIEALGLILVAMHPGINDPSLLPYFTIEVPDSETADRVILQLLQLPAVAGAYVKPPDEPPDY
jgi:hypothetical protein